MIQNNSFKNYELLFNPFSTLIEKILHFIDGLTEYAYNYNPQPLSEEKEKARSRVLIRSKNPITASTHYFTCINSHGMGFAD